MRTPKHMLKTDELFIAKLDGLTLQDAWALIEKSLHVKRRRARGIIAELERAGYIRKEPTKIVVVKKGT